MRRGRRPGTAHERGTARLIQLTRWLGLAFVASGFAAIGLGWNQMARVTCVDCQLPYLLSAGAGGVGLIVLGVGLMLIAQIRAERARLVRGLATGPDATPGRLRSVDETEPGAEVTESRSVVRSGGT